MLIGVKLKTNIRGSNRFERKFLFYLILFRKFLVIVHYSTQLQGDMQLTHNIW